jgi:DNA invertase Pin-like site-specific DNA recombinase
MVVKELKERGVALLSLKEKLDTSSAAGELVFHVFGAIAHFERRLIAERTKDGIAAARAKGKLPGRRPLDPDKAKAALSLAMSGMSPPTPRGSLVWAARQYIAKWPWPVFGEQGDVVIGVVSRLYPIGGGLAQVVV